MFHLIKKDILIGRYYLLAMLLMVPFVTSMALLTMMDYFNGIVLGVFAILSIILSVFSSLMFINIDTVSRADELLKSLPVKKSTLVYSSFVSSFFMELLCIVLIYLTCLFFVYVIKSEDQYLSLIISYRGILIAIFGISMILLTILPFIFKYGGGKGGGIVFIGLIIVLLLPSLFNLLITALKDHIQFDFDVITNAITDLLRYLSNLHMLYIYLMIAGIFGITVFISIRLSVRFYKRRNL